MHSFEKLKIVGLQIMYMENIKNHGMTYRRKIGTHKRPPRKNWDLLMAQTKELEPTND